MSRRPKSEEADLRGEILRAAIICFHRSGYQATSVRQIVDTVGVTKGAFYYYYETKDELLQEINDIFLDHLLRQVDKALASMTSARMALAQLIQDIVAGFTEFHKHHAIFWEQRRFLCGSRFVRINEKRKQFEGRVVELIESGISSGEFRDLRQARVMALGVIGLATSPFNWSKHTQNVREVGELYSSVVLDGLTMREAID